MPCKQVHGGFQVSEKCSEENEPVTGKEVMQGGKPFVREARAVTVL